MHIGSTPAFASPRLRAALAACLLSTGLLAACAPAEDAAPSVTEVPAATTAPPVVEPAAPIQAPEAASAASGTIGGDGSQIQLETLGEADLRQADLQGELACSFSETGAPPLLHAKGVVDSDMPAQGVVKVAGYVEAIRAPGGFDGMTRGATFSGKGKTIHVDTTGDAIGGGESPAYPATLTYQRADGASRIFEGRWQCGP